MSDPASLISGQRVNSTPSSSSLSRTQVSVSGEELSVRLGEDDRLKDAIAHIGAALEKRGVSLPPGWEQRYVAAMVNDLGRAPEAGDVVTLPLDSNAVFARADAVSGPMYELAQRQYKSEQTLTANRRLRMEVGKQKRALRPQGPGVAVPTGGIGFNPRGRQKLTNFAHPMSEKHSVRSVPNTGASAAPTASPTSPGEESALPTESTTTSDTRSSRVSQAPSQQPPETATSTSGSIELDARASIESPPLSSIQRRFLSDFGIDPETLPLEAQQQLATMLDASQHVHAQLQRGESASIDGVSTAVQQRMVDGGLEFEVTVARGDTTLTLSRRVDLESRTLTTSMRFSSGETELSAERSYTKSPRVLQRLSFDVGPGGQLNPRVFGPPKRGTADNDASSEGIRSFVDGAILGDFGENDSWSAIAGQTALGFVPIAGQIADARDIAAALEKVARGESGAWIGLGASVAGIVPGLDFLKAGTRVGREVLAEAAEKATEGVAGAALKKMRKKLTDDLADDVGEHAAKRASKQFVQEATSRLKSLAAGRVELMERLSQLRSSKLMQHQWIDALRKARNALERNLKPSDLSGALRDKLGLEVRVPGSGRAWEHGTEVGNGLTALEKLQEALVARTKHLKGSGSASSSEVQALDEYIGAVSEMRTKIEALINMDPP
ncbi:MAG: hypothetical protein AAF735_06900 [Myxococcota bacterium]